MRNALLALAAATLSTLAAAPAVAQAPAADRADVRCVVVLQAVSRDPKQQEAATRGLFYYLGKLSARGPVGRIEPAMMAEARAITTPQEAQAELTRCGQELTQRTGDLQGVNQRLTAAVQGAQPKAPAAPAPKPK